MFLLTKNAKKKLRLFFFLHNEEEKREEEVKVNCRKYKIKTSRKLNFLEKEKFTI